MTLPAITAAQTATLIHQQMMREAVQTIAEKGKLTKVERQSSDRSCSLPGS